MRALLVNPWIYDFAAYDLWSKPLGLLSIASSLSMMGWEIDLVDCLDRFHIALKQIPSPDISDFGDGQYLSEEIEKPSQLAHVPRKYKRYGIPRNILLYILHALPRPDIILVTTGMTYWYRSYQDIISLLKEIFFQCPVIIGGNYVNICHDHAKRTSGVDVAFKGRDKSEMVSCIHRLTGIYHKGAVKGISDGNFPLYSLYPKLRYATLRTSGGCPFKCTYCGWYLFDSRITQEDPDKISGMIENLYFNRGVRDFAFYDEALLYNAEKHIVKIIESLIRKKVKARFHTPNGLHNKFMTEEIAHLMREAGFMAPRLALETSYKDRQRLTGSKTTTNEFINALSCLNKAGYDSRDIGAYILIGLPGQSFDEISATIEFAGSNGVRIHLEEYSPIPNTPAFKEAGFDPDMDPLLHNNSTYPVLGIQGMDRLAKLKNTAKILNRVNSYKGV